MMLEKKTNERCNEIHTSEQEILFLFLGEQNLAFQGIEHCNEIMNTVIMELRQTVIDLCWVSHVICG